MRSAGRCAGHCAARSESAHFSSDFARTPGQGTSKDRTSGPGPMSEEVARASRLTSRDATSGQGTSKDRTSGPRLSSEEAARASGLTSRGARRTGRRAVQIVNEGVSTMSILCQGICS